MEIKFTTMYGEGGFLFNILPQLAIGRNLWYDRHSITIGFSWLYWEISLTFKVYV
jgi:hypothetical protein